MQRAASSDVMSNKKATPLRIEIEGRTFSFNNTQVDMRVNELSAAALGLTNNELAIHQPSTSSLSTGAAAALTLNNHSPTITTTLLNKLQLPTIGPKEIVRSMPSAPLTSTRQHDSSSTLPVRNNGHANSHNRQVIESTPTTSNHHSHIQNQHTLVHDFTSLLSLKPYQLSKLEPPPPAATHSKAVLVSDSHNQRSNPKKLKTDFYDDDNNNNDEYDEEDEDVYNDVYHAVNNFTDSFRVSLSNRLPTAGLHNSLEIAEPAPADPHDIELLSADLNGSAIRANNIVFSDESWSSGGASKPALPSKQIMLIKNRKRSEKKKLDMVKKSNPVAKLASVINKLSGEVNGNSGEQYAASGVVVATHDASLPQVFGVNIQNNDKSSANESNFF
jgi:hypothetical protein